VVVQDLRGMREPEPADRDGLEGAELDAAVTAVAAAVQDRQVVPGQPGAAVQQVGLVGLDGEQVGRVLARHEELGGGVVGLQRVGDEHRPGEARSSGRGSNPGTARRAIDLVLGEHGAGGVVHHGEQVHQPAGAASAT
jgi:hypothetical protein